MTNTYFNHTNPFARFTTADAIRLNATLKAVEAGFDKFPTATEINQGTRNYAVATNIANAYSVTVPYQITSYNTGMQLTFLAATANTSSATLNVNTIGSITIKRFDGTNLIAGDIRAVSLNSVVFDGTEFRLLSMHGGTEALVTLSASQAGVAATQAGISAAQALSSQTSAAASAVSAATSAATSGASLASNRFGLRNTIMNPVFWITNPLGNVFSGTYLAGRLIRDRWRAGTTGITFSISNYIMTITAGRIQQVVQGRNILQAGDYTLSWNGTSTATVNGVAVSNGGIITLPGAANATISWGVGTLHHPQFEYSSIKTQFEIRPTDLEIQLCSQYYQKSYNMLVAPGTVTHDGVHFSVAYSASNISQPTVYFSTQMRAAPSVGVFNPRTLNLAGSFDSMDTSIPYPVAVEPSENSFKIYNPSATFVVGGRMRFHWVADAEL